jgi:hypothetical protein
MTRHSITTHGNAKSWRGDGYRNTMRVPGPIANDEPTLGQRVMLIAVPIAIGLVAALIGLVR